jgi:YHS domain-containing protein
MKTKLTFGRSLPALLAAPGTLLGVLSPAAHAHDVTDPVCRMSVDSDTTPFHQKLGGKTFHFCSKACAAKFAKAPAKYSKLADALARGGGRTYAVDLTSAAPPVAGKPSALTFAVRHADGTRAAIRDFETTHEKLMHLIVVSEDLSCTPGDTTCTPTSPRRTGITRSSGRS